MVAGYIIDGLTALHRRRTGALPARREMPHNFVLCRVLSPRVKWAFWLSNAPYWYLCHDVARRALAADAAAPWLECLRPLCASSLLHAACVGVIALASTAFHGAQLELDVACACACGFRNFKGFELATTSANGRNRTGGGAVARAPAAAEGDRPKRRGRSAAAAAAADGGERSEAGGAATTRLETFPSPSLANEASREPTTPTASRGRRALVSRLLLCDVLCANVYVLFLASCLTLGRVARTSLWPVACMFVAAQAKRRGRYGVYVFFHSAWHVGSAWAIHRSIGG